MDSCAGAAMSSRPRETGTTEGRMMLEEPVSLELLAKRQQPILTELNVKGLSSPPRKRGSRGRPQNPATLDSRFRGNDVFSMQQLD
jgi:hypothetical protein